MKSGLQGLLPIIDKRTKVLILGSFPGCDSLKHRQYYAHSRNHFWEIASVVLNKDIASLGYNRKKKALLQNGIGLWDVIRSCRRKGSSDGKIANYCINDITGLVKKYPNIQAIFLNGRKAENLFKAAFPVLSEKAFYLPSSSPANAGMPLTQKVNLWRKIKTY
jgi:TDG/mug DNA glycosylase family protein